MIICWQRCTITYFLGLFVLLGASSVAGEDYSLKKGARTGALFLADARSITSFDWWEPPMKTYEAYNDDSLKNFTRTALFDLLEDSSEVRKISADSLKHCSLALVKRYINSNLNMKIVKVFAPVRVDAVSDTLLIALIDGYYLNMQRIINNATANHWIDSTYVRSVRVLFKTKRTPVAWVEIGLKRYIYASRDDFDDNGEIRKDPQTGEPIIEGIDITEINWYAYVFAIDGDLDPCLIAYKIPIYYRKEVDKKLKTESQIDVAFPNPRTMTISPRTKSVTIEQRCWLGKHDFR